MSIRHGVYIQEEATAVQVPKTGNSSVQVVVGTAPVNMAENPSEAVNVPILANSGTEAMAALGYSVDFKNFTLCQTMFATSNLFQVSPVVYINVLDPAKHNKELAEAEYQVNQKQAVIEKEGIILEGLTVKNSTGDTELKAGEDYSAAFDSATGFLTITMLAGGKGAAKTQTTQRQQQTSYRQPRRRPTRLSRIYSTPWQQQDRSAAQSDGQCPIWPQLLISSAMPESVALKVLAS